MGNNPNTAYHYANKNTEGILKAYNPPSIVPDYSNKVFKVMNIIGLKELTIDPTPFGARLILFPSNAK